MEEFYLLDFEVYLNTRQNKETPPHDYNDFNDFEKLLSNSCEFDTCNRIIEAKIRIQEWKIDSPEKFLLGHLNIDSLRNKLYSLKNTTGRNIDILLISETNLDDSFASA